MKDEYDFSNAEQGKFYRPSEELEIPIYLDKDVTAYLMKKISTPNETSVSDLVNTLLKNDIEIAKKLA